MAKAVLISIRPEWVEKILDGEKTFEVRKNRPKSELPFKCYIYETQGRTETPWICEKELCGGCPWDQSPDINGEYEFDCEWRRPLRRPPQSWCYVEELKNG